MKINKIKRYKSESYTTICNDLMKEKNVSLKAKGLYALVMSLSTDWDFSVVGICSIVKEKESAVYAATKELIGAGYCDRKMITEKGKFIGCEYSFFEKKNKKPLSEKPHVDFPHTENQETNNINKTNNNSNNSIPIVEENKEKRISNDIPKNTRFVKPTVEQVEAYCREKKYDLDAQYFIDYYDARGWMLGKNHIKDWKACIRTWMRKSKENNNSENPASDQQPREELPAGLDATTWDKFRAWGEKAIPRIINDISPEDYVKMLGMAHLSKSVMIDILKELNEGEYEGDLLGHYDSLRESPAYWHRIIGGNSHDTETGD